MERFLNFLKGQIRYIGLFIILSLFLLNILQLFLASTYDDVSELISITRRIEDPFFDLRFKKYVEKKSAAKSDPDIVLADIDDQSLKEIGRWPWSRTVWADFLLKMKKANAKVLAFDVMFSEPELACNQISPDIKFSEAIKEFQTTGGKVVLPFLFTHSDESFKPNEIPDILINNIVDNQNKDGFQLTEFKISNETFPVPELIKAEPLLGNIEMAPDLDGVFRNYQVVGNINYEGFGNLYLPSLGISAFNAFFDKHAHRSANLDISLANGSYLTTLKGEGLTSRKLEVNFEGKSPIRYVGGAQFFNKMSFKQIMSAQTNEEDLKKFFNNKIVFIGSTSTGAHDLRSTPIDPVLPGVYVHMNFLRMIMDQFYFKNFEENLNFTILFLIVGCLIIILVQHFLKNIVVELLTLAGIIFLVNYLEFSYFIPEGYQLKLATVYFCYIFTYSWNTVINFSQANKEKKQIKGAFSRYVAPAIVNQMLDNPDKLKLGGEKKEITCIFSDVRDFTSISEKLTPTQLSTALNMYMSKMTDILFETYGTLDKYIGDAIVGYWGAPLSIENHAYHAVRGSVKMIEALPGINQLFKEQNFPEFKIGIGLNSGECSVGNMGSDKIFSYTALGDNMNLGSRLESLCKFYGVQIHISEYTYQSIPENLRQEFKFRPLDRMKVKGKEKPVNTFEVLHSTHDFALDTLALKQYIEAYEMYQNRQFDQALVITNELLNLYPNDKPTSLIKKNCEHYIEEPPGPDWDGVTTHKEK